MCAHMHALHTNTHTHTGLLTVDAKNRLTLKDLTSHPWLTPQSAPSTPLRTSCILGRDKGTASALKHTFHAFYQATKAGFTLGDVSRAPLAKRRKNKRELSPYKLTHTHGDSGGAIQLEQPTTRPNKLDLNTHDVNLAPVT